MPPRIISMLLIGQLLVVFLGVVITGSFLRVYHVSFPVSDYPGIERGFPFLVRDYGFWLSLLPLGWAIAALRDAREATEKNTANNRFELVGWLLLGTLLILFVFSAWLGYKLAFYSGPQQMNP